jgi:hypothetical protein
MKTVLVLAAAAVVATTAVAHRGLMALAIVTALGVSALPAVAQTTDSGSFGSGARVILIRGGGGGHFGGGGFRGAFGHVGTSMLGSHAMANGLVGGGLRHMSREAAKSQGVGFCANPITALDGEEALTATTGRVELRTAV